MKPYKKADELFLGYYKISSGKASVTWPESVDEALCFGWIDGVRKSIDEASYFIRFTKRQPSSIWSAVNIAKVEKLQKQGLMKPEGIAAYEKRKEHKSKIYSYERGEVALAAAYEKLFKANKPTWTFFAAQAPSYRKVTIHQVMGAKQEKTQQSRLEKLILASADKKRLSDLSHYIKPF
ncbi:MAG: hypothetical protein JWQ38_3711 [Flavipsychrobacter sp.]|nr:hypothetical protein [Flavipsychrobacter sp.]